MTIDFGFFVSSAFWLSALYAGVEVLLAALRLGHKLDDYFTAGARNREVIEQMT